MSPASPLFQIPLISGIVFLIVGIVLLKFPPGNINAFYGYRTPRSMKSKDSWDFAQRYSAQQLIMFGTVLALSSVVGLIYQPPYKYALLAGLGLMIIALIAIIVRVERALKKRSEKK